MSYSIERSIEPLRPHIERLAAERADPRSWASGPRNIASMLTHTSSTFGVTLERVGGMVTLGCYARQFDLAGASAGDLLLTLPAGFRPSSTYRASVASHSSAQIEVTSSGQVKLMGGTIAQDSYVSFHLSHLTTDDIPSILPGL